MPFVYSQEDQHQMTAKLEMLRCILEGNSTPFARMSVCADLSATSLAAPDYVCQKDNVPNGFTFLTVSIVS